MRFSDRLLEDGEAILEAQKEHPFVRELAAGTLDEAAFRHWVEQDYQYLLDYARVFAIAGTKAGDGETMTRLLEVAHAIVDHEMDLHREFASEYGLARADLEAVEKAPTCVAYTNYLVRTAHEGSLAEIAAAIYPCGRGYLDVAEHMADLADGTPLHAVRREVHGRGVPRGRGLDGRSRGSVCRGVPRGARGHARGVPRERAPRARLLGDGLHARGVADVRGTRETRGPRTDRETGETSAADGGP